MDHVQDDLTTLEKFRNILDPVVIGVSEDDVEFLFVMVKECFRSHSKRPCSSQVCPFFVGVSLKGTLY